jgi:hypothetical protein
MSSKLRYVNIWVKRSDLCELLESIPISDDFTLDTRREFWGAGYYWQFVDEVGIIGERQWEMR